MGGEALEREHREIEAEDRALDALRYRINSRRRQYPDELPPAAYADDQLDLLDYNHRLTVRAPGVLALIVTEVSRM